MGIVRKNITFTAQMNAWVQRVVAQGDYANESEYIRDLIRHDKEKRSREIALQQEIQEGLDSGTGHRNVLEIMGDVEQRMRDDGRL